MSTLNQTFYAVVVTGALAGASDVAADRLDWPLLAAVAIVGAVEFGGVVVSAHADRRRRLGERAAAARIMSALVAAGAVTVNVWGHIGNPFQAAFFGGLSALGYAMWLLDSGARYRDAQRAAGRMAAIPPVYGLWMWLRHPGLARRARHLALTTGADKLGSLDAARQQVRTERRQAAIAATLRKRIAERVGPVMADVAVNTFDLDEVAIRLTRGADYDGLAALLAAELVPARLAPVGVVEPVADGQLRHRVGTDEIQELWEQLDDEPAPAPLVEPEPVAEPERTGKTTEDPKPSRTRGRMPGRASRPAPVPARRRIAGGNAPKKVDTMRAFFDAHIAEHGEPPGPAAMDRAADANGMAKKYRPQWVADLQEAGAHA